jgi:hypothetical protein
VTSVLCSFLSAKISSRLKMLQKLPAAALNRAGAFAAARAATLRTAQRLGSVGTSFGHRRCQVSELGCSCSWPAS